MQVPGRYLDPEWLSTVTAGGRRGALVSRRQGHASDARTTSPRPRARRWRTSGCAATCTAPPGPSGRGAPRPSRSCPTSRSSASRRGASRTTRWAASTSCSRSSRRRPRRRGRRCITPPTPTAACAVVAGIAADHGVTELVKMKSLATDEIRLDAALAEAGVERRRDRPRRAHRPAGRRHGLAHPGAGRALQPRADPRHLPAHHRARSRHLRRPQRARGGLAPVPARALPARRAWE